MAALSTITLTSEVACVNSTPTIVANSFQVTNLTASNGNVVRVLISGINPPQAAPNPGTVIQLYAGPNGNTTDMLLSTALIPPQVGGVFAAEFLATCRANGKANVQGNSVWSATSILPLQSYGTGLGLVSPVTISGPTSNGNVNVNMISTTSNLCNLTVVVTAASGVNATSLVQNFLMTLIA